MELWTHYVVLSKAESKENVQVLKLLLKIDTYY